MQAVGKWSVFDLGIARVKGLEDLIEQGLGLCLELFQADLMLAAGCGCIFFRILVISIFIHDSKSSRFLIYVVVCLMSIRI